MRMNCEICQMAISTTDKKTETPCCDRIFHSQCAINMIANNVYHSHDVVCLCGGIIYKFHHHYMEETENAAVRMEELIKQPLARVEFKKLKNVVSNRNKSNKNFVKKIKEVHNVFCEQTQTNIDMIKNFKKLAIKSINDSNEYKEYSRNCRQVTYYSNRFKRMFNVNDREIFSKFRGKWWRRWRDMPIHMIRRKFRLRF